MQSVSIAPPVIAKSQRPTAAVAPAVPSEQAVGQQAKAAVAQARADGVDLPKNAQGLAASGIARGAEPASVFAALYQPIDPVQAAPDVASGDAADVGDPNIFDADSVADTADDALSPVSPAEPSEPSEAPVAAAPIPPVTDPGAIDTTLQAGFAASAYDEAVLALFEPANVA